MKKVMYIFFCVFVLGACNSKSELEGIWIGAYGVDYSKETTSIIEIKGLFHFSKDELTIKSFENPSYSDSIHIEKFTVKNGYLFFDLDTFKIESVNKDSLVLSESSSLKRKFIFRKLSDQGNNLKVNLANKTFKFEGEFIDDSLDFISDSTLIFTGFHLDRIPRSINWAINSYQGHQFLVIDEIGYVPFLIEHSTDKTINLKAYHVKEHSMKLSEIRSIRDTTGLQGKWEWFNLMLSDFPYPQNYSKKELTMYLNIDKDSIEIKQLRRTRSKKWGLSSTNDFIYFPDDLNTSDGVWEILSVNKENLTIQRSKRSDWHNAKEVLEFKRSK